MADLPVSYLPQDRRHALAADQQLPDRTHGAALFADISGFTPLAERLAAAHGPRRGTELLTDHINAAYDAIMCWFNDADGPSAPRAAACALAMQAAMCALRAAPYGGCLALKVAVAAGPARRFVVGDPSIQLLDAVAGATIARAAAGEHLTRPGEVLLDAATAAALDEGAEVGAVREDPETGERFSLLRATGTAASSAPWSLVELTDAAVHPWLLPVVAERYAVGLGAFLTELRPAAVLFLRFGGIDYDCDDRAGDALDSLVRRVQQEAAARGGTLLQLTIGDKGSYAYAAFGAPVAHEDDARRAAQAALAIHASVAALGLPPAQIGLSQGTLRVGAYGGRTRHTYGALGDEVNLAARLMTAARPGETLASSRLQQALGATFIYEPRMPLPVKGKAEPLPIFALAGPARRRAIRLQEPHYTLPLIGRSLELAKLEALLAPASQGRGQVVSIVGEAGIGKSRLVAEAVRLARRRGLSGYGGAAESTGATPYLVWRPIFQALLDLDPDAPLRRQVRHLEGELEERVPGRAGALPLLGQLLDLPLEENTFTRTLAPEERRGALAALLIDLLEQAAHESASGGGLLLVLEDLHWADPLSLELFAVIAAIAAELPLLILTAYRPFLAASAELARITALPHHTQVALSSLGGEEIAGLVRAKLAQLIPARGGALPKGLVARLLAQTQGNPFYVEELVSYVHDRGINPYEPASLEALELPDSLHRLVLARIDQLSERERTTLRVASVIGRLFPAGWLRGMVPDLGAQGRINADLEALARQDLMAVEVLEPELTYLFKHIVTQEVAYDSLPHATRKALHEQLAGWLEAQGREPPPLDLLVHHYGRSANDVKRREYLRRAGEAHLARGNFAAATTSLAALLALLSPEDDRYTTTARLVGETYTGLGDHGAAERALRAAESSAKSDTDRALASTALAKLIGHQGDYISAAAILERTLQVARCSGDEQVLMKVLLTRAEVAWRQGRVDAMEERFVASLTQARAIGDRASELASLNGIGLVAFALARYEEAAQIWQRVYDGARMIGNRKLMEWGAMNVGVAALAMGDYSAAHDCLLRALAITQEIGDQESAILLQINLAELSISTGHLEKAREQLRSAAALARRRGMVPVVLGAVAYFATLAYAEGDVASAMALYAVAMSHSATSGDTRRELEQAMAGWGLDAETVEVALARGGSLDLDMVVQELLRGERPRGA